MTEVLEGDEIISLSCYICNKESLEGEVAFCLFGERFRGGAQHSTLSDILSSILSFEIQEETAHSKIICQPCSDRLNKYEELEQQMLDLRYKIIQDFSITSRLNDGEIQFEIETAFDVAIEEALDTQPSRDDEAIHNEEETKPNIEATKNVDLISLLSGHKVVAEHIQNTNTVKARLVVKEEISESELDEGQYFDQNTGNMVEEIIAENDEYNQIVEQAPRSLDSSSMAEQQIENENNDSQDDCSDDQSYIYFNGLKYTCLICSTNSSNEEQTNQYDDADAIYNHLQTIHDITAYICYTCGQDFTDQDHLIQHRREKHDVDSEIKLSVMSDSHEDHKPYYTFNGESFSCLMCPPGSEAAKTKCAARALSNHFKTVHNLRLYICDICGVDFKKRMELTEHVDGAHGGTEDGEFQCDTCNRVFTNLRQFRIHKRLHYTSTKSYQCNQCNKKYSSKNLLDEHMNMHTGLRPYKCPNCTKDFASKYTLTAHMKIHSDRPRPFSCKLCAKSFFSAQNLLQHEKIHSGLKEYICEVCNKAFGTQHNLEVHKVVHTGYKPFICRTCGKAFARRAEIKDHERTHTGERPFVCDICNMSFAQRSNLTTHKRATHLNDKRYKCEQCDRSFKRRRLLNYHIRASHTGERPYLCNLCNATFVYPEHYKKHLRIHSGVKPYSCEVCGKSFNSRDNRNAHRFIHSDKKPYECLVCGQGFMRKPLLYTHMQQSGHVNDTIIINQPRIMTESDDKKSNNENVLIEMVHDDDLVEEQLIDGPSQYNTSADEEMDDVIDHDDENSMSNDILDDDLSEVMNSDQFVVRYDGDAEPMQLVQIRTKDESGKDAFTWVNLVSEKDN